MSIWWENIVSFFSHCDEKWLNGFIVISLLAKYLKSFDFMSCLLKRSKLNAHKKNEKLGENQQENV